MTYFPRVRIKPPGWRGFSLLGLAIFAGSRAAIYLPPEDHRREVPASIRALTEGSPLTVTGWGVLWAAVALLLTVAAFSPRLVTWALAGFLLLTTGAAAAYGLSWLLLFPPDNGEWSSALLYLGLAVASFGLVRVNQRNVENAALLALLRSLEADR